MNWKRVFTLVLACGMLAGIVWVPAGAAGSAQVGSDEPVLVDVINGWATGESMDPALDYEANGIQILAQIYDTLVAPPRNPGDSYLPNLAADWTVSADGLTYTFYIHKGVHFSNGALLTPEDVAYTFRRGLLMGGSASPQWLLFEPLLGSTPNKDISDLVDSSGNLMDDRTALQNASSTARTAACQKVFKAVAFNDATGTVTFRLVQPWGPFIETLTGSWGSILDKGWVIDQGGWDGQCATWANYYATPAAESEIAAISNGTGPYIFTSVDGSGNVILNSNPNYWRTEPMWPGGPVGEAYYKTVLLKNIPNATERKNMLLNGEAQIAIIDIADRDEVDDQVLFSYTDETPDGALMNPAGVVKRYTSKSTSTTDLFFNYNTVKSDKYTVGTPNSFGDSVPSNFFTDEHVRRAFSYAFDWDKWIAEGFDGHAIQRRGVIPLGFTGYSDSQPVFSKDLAKAADELKLAWRGKLVTQGFTLTIAYNQDNLQRQLACEILKANIESIATNYHVNILALPWDEYVADYRNRLIPLWVTSWTADLNHPHNFAVPYLTRGGTYASRQSLPADLLGIFEPKVHECVVLPVDQAQSCYEGLQNLSYQYMVDIWGAQSIQVTYTRAELQGHSQRLANNIVYYYNLYETPLPVPAPYSIGEVTAFQFMDPRGGMGDVSVPATAFGTDVTVLVTPGKPVSQVETGFRFGQLAFDISAYGPDGAHLSPNFDPAHPVLVVIHYDESDLTGINESTLRLLYWTGAGWEDGACGEQVVDTAANTLTVPLCHFSDFALAGHPVRYLPLIIMD